MHYGVANKDGRVTRSEARDILQIAANAGIDTLDTAIGYGESEFCLGEIGVRNFKLITKLPAISSKFERNISWVSSQVEESIDRLHIKSLYGLLLHHPRDLLSNDGKFLYRALQKLKDKGRIQKIGVSVYSPQELDAIANLFDLDLVQAPFNLIDQRFHSSGWLDKLKDKGVEIHVRSVFLQGLLLIKSNEIPEKFWPWNPLWENWHDWIGRSNSSPIKTCLDFVRSYKQIDRIIVGVDNVAQLNELVASFGSSCSAAFPNIVSNDDDLINPSKWL
jgi:aryl-alcohol dehydrogenase-like predicted oxidoreductase